jgi:hypothetical protein
MSQATSISLMVDALAAAEGALVGLDLAGGHADLGGAGGEVGESGGGAFSSDVEADFAALFLEAFRQGGNELGTERVGTTDAERGLGLSGEGGCDDEGQGEE